MGLFMQDCRFAQGCGWSHRLTQIITDYHRLNKLTIDKLPDLRGKRVLVRVDFNVPMEDGKITDETRIKESLPTIKKIIGDGGKCILMSHLGRPKGEKNLKYSLRPAAIHLAALLRKSVFFSDDCIGQDTRKIAAELKNGGVLLLENLRFHEEEEENDDNFSKELASYGDIYVNDAFGAAHRAHASTVGVTKFISTRAAGYLMEKELEHLSKIVNNPEHPFTAILGGSKISGKIDVIKSLLEKADRILIGGGMVFTFYKAMGSSIGKSLLEEDKIKLAKELIENAKGKIILPIDIVVADKFENSAKTKIVYGNEMPDDMIGMDIGPETIKIFTDEIKQAKTIFWNGPMGVFEMNNFAKGTYAIAKAMAEATKKGAFTVIGGGDSVAAVNKAGVTNKISHVSTGGGASLEYLEGKRLPGVEALSDI
jgi:phosphoglycerate kinase